MARRALSLSKVYGLLETGPVVLLTTADGEGRANVMTQSWHTMLEFEPPLVACVVSGRNHSFDALVETKECVIAIPTVELAKQVAGCGNCSGRKTDKFRRFGLTPAAGSEVRAPLIAECYVNLECRVVDDRMVDAYNLFVLEVVKAWKDSARQDPRTLHHRGRGAFMIAGDTVKLLSRMR